VGRASSLSMQLRLTRSSPFFRMGRPPTYRGTLAEG
jgi:hypothetical protein